MRKLISTRRPRAARLVAPALVAAAVLAGVAGLVGATSARANGAVIPLPTFKDPFIGILGTPGNDKIALRLEHGNDNVLEVDFGDDGSAERRFSLDGVSTIVVAALGGNDQVRIDESNGVFTDRIATTLRGGTGDDTLIGGAGRVTLHGDSGNDTLIGGSGAEILDGGTGNDQIDGNRGNDLALMGAGDDTFTWDPGDGSDTIEGQDGFDTMVFNGAPAAEKVDLSANGNRLRFFRDVAGITMDTAGVERVDFNALGGADLVTVHDLSATDVTNVNVDLAGTLGGSAGDGASDQVVVEGTKNDDAIDVSGNADEVKVGGLAATVGVLHSEVAKDRLDYKSVEGTDTVDTGGLEAGALPLFVDNVFVK